MIFSLFETVSSQQHATPQTNHTVIPAQAGIQGPLRTAQAEEKDRTVPFANIAWIPACAGMTLRGPF